MIEEGTGRHIAGHGDEYWHGTDNGYKNYGCRCTPCTKASSKAMAAAKERRMARPIPEHVHGTSNGYGNYGCRCRPCTSAWTADTMDRAKRRKERQLRGEAA